MAQALDSNRATERIRMKSIADCSACAEYQNNKVAANCPAHSKKAREIVNSPRYLGSKQCMRDLTQWENNYFDSVAEAYGR